MSGTLKVDLAAFGELIDTVGRAADALKQSSGALKNVSARDLGTHSLDSAAARFQDRWGYGIEKIAYASATMVDGLKETRTTYAKAEESNQSLMKMFEAPLSAGGSGPAPQSPASQRVPGILNMDPHE
ncbi:hypothetical protein G4X40_14090 [Rhodococcus sp. D2-41]|uniref:Uncharacterized protein n=2 Tax=Speluncibacter jeojiensis TaxID=2710754 RepID=A0A9X4M297_9ACTN|nr:hypothetical protein [Rhodococcus sp. D2-41]MDG3015866.1 hypothetical protein [Corynebacteriales bacterium D3-21]